MKLPEHWINWAIDRWYDPNDMLVKKFRCERNRNHIASEIHHIWSSYRWKRNNEARNLIALCYTCHREAHARNNFDTRTELAKISLLNAKNKNDNTRMTSFE